MHHTHSGSAAQQDMEEIDTQKDATPPSPVPLSRQPSKTKHMGMFAPEPEEKTPSAATEHLRTDSPSDKVSEFQRPVPLVRVRSHEVQSASAPHDTTCSTTIPVGAS